MVKQRFQNWRIGARLGAGFAVVLCVMLAMAAQMGWVVSRLSSAHSAVEAINQRHDTFVRWSTLVQLNLSRALSLAQSGYHDGLAASTEPLMKATSQQITQLQEQVKTGLATADERRLFATIGQRRKAYVELRTQVMERFKAGDVPAAQQLVDGPMGAAAQAYLAALAAMEQALQADRADTLQVAHERARSAYAWLAAMALLALAVGGTVAWRLGRYITRPLAAAVQTARRIAAGDLSVALPERPGHDELGELQQALAAMQAQLRELVGRIRHSTASIGVASGEIAAGSHDLSVRTEDTASKLQQAASSMELLTATVGETAASARTARDLAGNTLDVAERGGQVVRDVVSTMGTIQDSARRIADIIGTIDAIAFQTNILALNAAVESARAGEHGRGFAVVAGEVRGLAQRSADAAREIKALIHASVERVDVGTRLVDQAGATMQDIVGSVHRVSDLIAEITTVAAEQSDGLQRVNAAVAALDRATQQNAALVEQSAASAESLREQSAGLQAMVGRFTVT
jgi:methyl-accepting chemotaxis protein